MERTKQKKTKQNKKQKKTLVRTKVLASLVYGPSIVVWMILTLVLQLTHSLDQLLIVGKGLQTEFLLQFQKEREDLTILRLATDDNNKDMKKNEKLIDKHRQRMIKSWKTMTYKITQRDKNRETKTNKQT